MTIPSEKLLSRPDDGRIVRDPSDRHGWREEIR